MLSVAQVCRIGPPHVGGMERVIAGLSGALNERGHRVEVFTLDRALTTGEPLPSGLIDGIRYHRLRRIGPRRYPFAAGLVRAVRGFDLVHVHGLDGLADVLVRARPAPVGVSTHGGYFHTDRYPILKALALRTVTRATLRRADAVWYTSEADRARLAAARVAGDVLPDGVEVERFASIRRAPEAGRWIAYGRVDVHKGLDDLLRALARVRRPFRLDVVGPEARRGLLDGLRAQAEALGLRGRVTVHGALADDALRPLLEWAELALFPSRYEGFGLTVIEMMAAGIVPVVSPIPAYDALVTPGVDGLRVPWADPEAAAQALERTADLERLAAAARITAAAHGWSARVGDYERAYEAVLARAGRRSARRGAGAATARGAS